MKRSLQRSCVLGRIRLLDVDEVMEPAVARGMHVDRTAGVTHDEYGFDGLGSVDF